MSDGLHRSYVNAHLGVTNNRCGLNYKSVFLASAGEKGFAVMWPDKQTNKQKQGALLRQHGPAQFVRQGAAI